MLFCLNPPHSLPFPHWPDGATLPAAAAADVSLARWLLPRSPPRPEAHCSSARTLRPRRGGCKLAGTLGARRAEGLGGGDARGRRQLALPPAPRSASGGWRNPRPQPGRAGGFPFSPSELRGAWRTGPKKSRKSCLPPAERSRSSLCLESQHLRLRLQCVPGELALGRPAGEGGSPGSCLVSEADRAGDFYAFVLIFWKSLFSSLARHRACPDLTAAPPALGCGSERFLAGFLPRSLTLKRRVPGGPTSAKKEAGGVANTRTQTLTCSRAERRKPEAERTAGAASPAGSE